MLIQGHQPCDRCGSSDALAIYSDNTKCFSCGWLTRITSHSIFPNQNKSKLCTQISDNFPKEALSYLLKYRIFQSDIISSGIKYDNKASRILFPMAANGSYQGRSLDKNQIKYMTYGDKNYKLFGDDNVVVLCEDWLSSYRVSQQPGISAVCIFGTSCSNGSLLKLVSHKCKLILWLDGDKPGQDAAKKITKSLALYYPSIYNVTTPQDPKTYSDNEIREAIYERIGYYEGSTEER
jgi:twinkle protein